MVLQNEQQFNDYFYMILEKSKFNSTYKLAFLIAIAKVCQQQDSNLQESIFISYEDIASYFIEIYWNSTKEFAKKNGEMSVLRHGINTGTDNIVSYLTEYKSLTRIGNLKAINPQAKYYRELIVKISKLVKDNPAKFLQAENGALYDYENRTDGIVLNENIASFFHKNAISIIRNSYSKLAEVVFNNPKNELSDESFSSVKNFIFNDGVENSK